MLRGLWRTAQSRIGEREGWRRIHRWYRVGVAAVVAGLIFLEYFWFIPRPVLFDGAADYRNVCFADSSRRDKSGADAG